MSQTPKNFYHPRSRGTSGDPSRPPGDGRRHGRSRMRVQNEEPNTMSPPVISSRRTDTQSRQYNSFSFDMEQQDIEGEYDEEYYEEQEQYSQLPNNSPNTLPIPPLRRSTPSRKTDGMIAMLQKQQAILVNVVQEQKKLLQTVERQEQKMQDLEATLESLATAASNPASPSSIQRKAKLPRDITNSVKSVHDSLDEGFRPDESSTSPFNRKVKENIVKEIKESKPNYLDDQIRNAVQCRYENLRRSWKDDEDDSRKEQQKVTSKKKKYRARRKRKFDCRSTVVKEEEKEKWKELTLDYMSEESDDSSDEQGIVVHPLQWRSQELVDFLHQLDERYAAKTSTEGAAMAKKRRKIGPSFNISQPTDAPQWTKVIQDS